ncbi:hypothetical protein FRACA_1310017 [Frankia canadensis]|uniref:Uncharacterized protein n=1 Tax=Frankia canadensis TaxID=1836972 RepID=A0A2I2KKU6_9ACTN|nr:hypothetical protein FRACA_1310017 [Frankia canadensis]SOU53557.1 hypothetical protein FRACA_1310017 [Frankia canadensis]
MPRVRCSTAWAPPAVGEEAAATAQVGSIEETVTFSTTASWATSGSRFTASAIAATGDGDAVATDAWDADAWDADVGDADVGDVNVGDAVTASVGDAVAVGVSDLAVSTTVEVGTAACCWPLLHAPRAMVSPNTADTIARTLVLPMRLRVTYPPEQCG